jgi:hypothetical protein
MNKQTAVEWLIEQLFFSDQSQTFNQYIEQAKAMEKEQTLVDYSCGARDAILNIDFVDAVKYYNETYGGDK